MMVVREDILRGLRNLGIGPGDVLMVHSSLKNLGYVEGGVGMIAEAFLEAVGPDGLVSVPTLTWDTVNSRQPVFDEALTPSTVGLFTNKFRLRPDALRSLHPTHSVAAIGSRAREFVACHETDDTPCGPHSPYRRLVEWSGKVVLLGVGLDVCTLFHAFEEIARAPWLFRAEPEVLFAVKEHGATIRVPSRRHSTEEGLERDYPSLMPLLLEKGTIRSGIVGQAETQVLEAEPAARLLIPLLKANPDRVLKKRGTKS